MAATTSGDGLGPELVAGTPLAAEARLSCLGPRDESLTRVVEGRVE